MSPPSTSSHPTPPLHTQRRIFPAVVVEELDAANAARLAEIRTAWEDLVAADLAAAGGRRLAMAARNAARLREYEGAVQAAYAQGLLRDVVFGVAVRTAANKEIMVGAGAGGCRWRGAGGALPILCTAVTVTQPQATCPSRIGRQHTVSGRS